MFVRAIRGSTARSSRLVLALVLICFGFSGLAGLVYQIVWARYLALFLGHTSYAVVAVLVAFMGGLALGNAWCGGRADRSRRPLRLYAQLELGIGLYALAFPAYYSFCDASFVALARHLTPGSGALLGLKFTFSLLTILPPTVLMGATFPVLTRFAARSLAELQPRVAALYAINSAGAVAGCLLADFWWIPTFGLPATVVTGAAINLLVGAVAWGLSIRIREGAETHPLVVPPSSGSGPNSALTPAPAEAGTTNESLLTGPELRLVLVGIGLSGFVAMLYEVAWTRMLAMALGSSTHAFSLMVATFITGITVGSWLVSQWKNPRRSLEAFACAELALAATLFGSMFFYERLPFWFVRLAMLLARRDEAYPLYQGLQALICFAVMFVPTVCLGMTLPLVSRLATQEMSQTGRCVGRVFAVNTLGTVLGAAVTGLWLMPALGLARTFAVGVMLNALIGVMILGRRIPGLSWKLSLATPPVLASLLGFAGWQWEQPWQRAFSNGLWRYQAVPDTLEKVRDISAEETVEYYRDGAGATVSVLGSGQSTNRHRSLKVNGKTDASTGSDLLTQLLIGHVPLLLRPDATQVLVIGLGSGMTGGAVLRHPAVQHLDVVEISPEVAQAARLFAEHNDRVLDQPRTRLVVEDAKTFLKVTAQDYDVIISEPSNPWMAGVAGVFSQEYFKSCRARLRPGGLMVQWLQLYETNDRVFDLVVRTFSSVFPNLSVWTGAPGDLLLIGSEAPLTVDLDALALEFHRPEMAADLKRFPITRLPVLLSHELISGRNGPFLASAAGPIHSDFHPRLEFLAQRAFFVSEPAEKWRRLDENLTPRSNTLLSEYLKSHPLTEADLADFARYQTARHALPTEVFQSLLLRWQREFPGSLSAPTLAVQTWDQGSLAELAARRLVPLRERMLRQSAQDSELLHFYARFLMQAYREQCSALYIPNSAELQATLRRLMEVNPDHRRVYQLHLAELAWDRGDDAECQRLSREAFDPDETRSGPLNFARDPQAPRLVLTRLMESLCRSGQSAEARQLFQESVNNRLIAADPSDLHPLLELVCRKAGVSFGGTEAVSPSVVRAARPPKPD